MEKDLPFVFIIKIEKVWLFTTKPVMFGEGEYNSMIWNIEYICGTL